MSLIEKAVEKLTIETGRKSSEDLVHSAGFNDSEADTAYIVNGAYVDAESHHLPLFSEGIFMSPDALIKKVTTETTESPVKRRVTKQSVTIDLKRLGEMGMITPEMPNQLIAEEFRAIKRRLILNAAGIGEKVVENGNLIMVTSAAPGEGKTFVAINIAISIAMELDRTVMLVDMDAVKSDVTRVLGIDAKLGMTDLLADPELQMPDVLLRTNIERLSILPAGRRLSNVTEQLASEKMGGLVMEVARRYRDRIIVFDSPPVLATSEASILSSLVGQIVVVVAAEKTKRSDLANAIEQLDHSKEIGLVLNKHTERPEKEYYEHYQSL